MNNAIICDIDGVLVNSYPQIQLKNNAIKEGKLSEDECWNLYYDNLDKCEKNTWCYRILEGLILDSELTILYITGREERARKLTEPFLILSKPYSYKLLMRPSGRKEPDSQIKEEILEIVLKEYNILFAIDDKMDNCEVYKKFHIKPLHVLN